MQRISFWHTTVQLKYTQAHELSAIVFGAAFQIASFYCCAADVVIAYLENIRIFFFFFKYFDAFNDNKI